MEYRNSWGSHIPYDSAAIDALRAKLRARARKDDLLAMTCLGLVISWGLAVIYVRLAYSM